MTNELVSITNLDKAIAFINKASAAQLKEVIGYAEAVRIYAIQSNKGLLVRNQAAEIKLRAERKLSEWYQKEPKNKGGKPVAGVQQVIPTLKELGLDRVKMSRIKAIASLPEKDFEKHMAEVKRSNEELTTIGVIRLARELGRKKSQDIAPLPKGVFNVIYADPPWKYDNSGISGAAQNHYPTMETENICKLKIPSADNAVLFLWVTNPFLKEGLQVCEAWGFEYKTNIVWIKQKAGQGFYVKGQHELLFIAVKGNCRPDNSLYVRSVVEVPKTKKHSQKPEEFYKIIETLYPKGKYLELFAREKYSDKWNVWGNEL